MSNKGLKFHPQALSSSEVEALMAACSATSPTGKRNRALIVVLWRGALRCEEALHLKVHDLDRGDGNIRVGDRTVEIEPRWWPVIETWLAARKFLNPPRSAPLFCTEAGCPVQSRYVRWMMASLRDKAKIRKRVHTEGLRKTRELEHLRDVRKRALAHNTA